MDEQPCFMEILQACNDLLAYQQKLVGLLADDLGISPVNIYYTWMERKVKQYGKFSDNQWEYFFHGFELNLTDLSNKNPLRVEFGPRGRLDTFTRLSLLTFVLIASPQGLDYPEIREALKLTVLDKIVDVHPFFRYFNPIFEKLIEWGWIERADKELFEQKESFTVVKPDGSRAIYYPSGLSEHQLFDYLVCNHWSLSAKGKDSLKTNG